MSVRMAELRQSEPALDQLISPHSSCWLRDEAGSHRQDSTRFNLSSKTNAGSHGPWKFKAQQPSPCAHVSRVDYSANLKGERYVDACHHFLETASRLA